VKKYPLGLGSRGAGAVGGAEVRPVCCTGSGLVCPEAILDFATGEGPVISTRGGFRSRGVLRPSSGAPRCSRGT